ncbi:hypothetical protein, partial [Eisenbergiella sp.]|uniref:hypothetical protein n=1 Tax=Eisenbergiella sp. TaxID=1924109 RepID=UPI002A8264EF
RVVQTAGGGPFGTCEVCVIHVNIVKSSDLVNTYFPIMISIIAYIMNKVYPHIKTRIKIQTYKIIKPLFYII